MTGIAEATNHQSARPLRYPSLGMGHSTFPTRHLAAALFLLCVGAASAQTPAASATPNPSPAPPLTATIAEVSLDLTVHSRHRKPVRDLQLSQLTVTDNGSPVQLSSLRLVNGAQSLITLLFDRLGRNSAQDARRMAEKILGVVPEQNYSLAVLQVNGRLHILQPYTQDRRLVDTAVAEATSTAPASPTSDLTQAEKTLIAAVHSDALGVDSTVRAEGKLLLSALEQSQRILEDRHGYPSLAALQALVLGERLMAARRIVVYFSDGITLNSDARERLKSIVELANRSGVIVCVVDTSPVDGKMSNAMQAAEAGSLLGRGTAPGSISSFGVGKTGGDSPAPSKGFTPGASSNNLAVHDTAQFEFGDVVAGDSPLVPLASGTGGIYFPASGGSKDQLEKLHEDLTTWYQASFTPPIKEYDGQFHPIEIRSQRKDLVIRARSGYFALPAESSGILPFEMPLLNILAGTALPSDIAFHAAVIHLGALSDGNSAELAVQVPISQLTIHEDANTHISSVHAAIVAVIKDSKGAVLQRFSQDLPLHETPEMLRPESTQAITLQRHFSAEPGTYTLETAVMDRIANKVGAQRTTFDIEPLPQGPALSDIALVKSIDPPEAGDQTFEPMLYQGRVIPNLATELPADTRSLSLFFLVHPLSSSQSQPTLRMQILRNDQLMADMPMDLQKVSGTGAAIPYLGAIQGQTFPPGEYEVKVLLSQDGSTVSRSTSFRVEGNIADAPSPNGPDPAPISEASTANSRFVISSPANPVPPPTDAEIQAMIEGARQRALSWFDTLPNFFCAEVTHHSVDATGHGDWKHKNTLVELMRYVDHAETRSTLLLDGNRSSTHHDELQFAHSAGEYGAMFHIVFDASAKAAFTWKQSSLLDGLPVQVFAFKVARENSAFQLYDRDGHTSPAGFHGLLYLDPATRSVRRISIVADDIPSKLLIRASSLSVDYSWISMQNHDFLLPVRGSVMLQETHRVPVLNEFEFRDYRRFGSKIRIFADDELSGATIRSQP